MEKSEAVKLEAASLNDLSRIELEAKRFGIDLVLIGGYAVRAYTNERSWRFTKDMDFVTTKKDLTALYGVFKMLGYSFEKTEFGAKGRKKINKSIQAESEKTRTNIKVRRGKISRSDIKSYPGDKKCTT